MTELSPSPNQIAEDAIRAVIAARDAVRDQTHLFSAETWRSWHELEREVATKLEDAEHRLVAGGAQVAETVSARAGELRRALDALLHEHAHRSVYSIMTRAVKTCRPADTLAEAARILWETDCGALPVVDAENKVLGMITDRDICMASYTRGAPLSRCTVASTMSPSVYTCVPRDSIQDVVKLMSERHVRRIPVVGPDGTLAGMVTIADLARHLDSLPEEHPARGLMVPTIAAITKRRFA